MYNLRISIYKGIKELSEEAITKKNVSMESIDNYRKSVDEALFLFDYDIVDYIDEILAKATRLHSLNSDIKNNISDSDTNNNHIKKCDETNEIVSWFVKELNYKGDSLNSPLKERLYDYFEF
jgi:DNA gyrase/topoisomerase IV subunit B